MFRSDAQLKDEHCVVVDSKQSLRGCFKRAYDFSVLALTDILSYRIPLRWVVLGCVLVSPIRGFQLQAAFSFKPWQLKRSSDIPNASLGREALLFSLRATALVTFPVWGWGRGEKKGGCIQRKHSSSVNWKLPALTSCNLEDDGETCVTTHEDEGGCWNDYARKRPVAQPGLLP